MQRPEDRRTSPRVNVAMQITYECFNPQGVKVDEGDAHTVNISGRGALIELEHDVSADARLLLCVKQPFYTLMMVGSVVHSHRVPAGHYRIGIQLIDVIEGAWQTWERLARPSWEDTPQ